MKQFVSHILWTRIIKHSRKTLSLSIYVQEVSQDQFLAMEREGDKAPEFGVEILGHIR